MSTLTIARDALRRAVIDNAQGNRGTMFSSSIDGRTNNLSPDLPPNQETCIYAWQPTFEGTDDSSNDLVTLEPATVSPYVVITVGEDEDPITNSPRPKLKIPNEPDTVQIVFLKLSTVAETVEDGFVIGCTIGAANVAVDTSIPPSVIGAESTLYIELFRWQNKQPISQVTRYNLNIAARGKAGSAEFTPIYAGAIVL